MALWIESHQTLGRHPKTLRLAKLLRCRVPEAVGLLQFLWWWALDYAADGLVAAEDKGVVAKACLWHGKPEVFWDALLQAGFVERTELDQVLRIHDWMQYTGRSLERRRQDAERKLESRTVRRTSSGQSGAAQPDSPDTPAPDVRRTGPNRTGPDLNAEVVAVVVEPTDRTRRVIPTARGRTESLPPEVVERLSRPPITLDPKLDLDGRVEQC